MKICDVCVVSCDLYENLKLCSLNGMLFVLNLIICIQMLLFATYCYLTHRIKTHGTIKLLLLRDVVSCLEYSYYFKTGDLIQLMHGMHQFLLEPKFLSWHLSKTMKRC